MKRQLNSHNVTVALKDLYKDQERRGGGLAIQHSLRVARKLCEKDDNSYLFALAGLHDVIEDYGMEAITYLYRHYDLPEGLMDDLIALTHFENETYLAYIERLLSKNNRMLVRIKLADMIDNLCDAPSKRQKDKYGETAALLLRAL